MLLRRIGVLVEENTARRGVSISLISTSMWRSIRVHIPRSCELLFNRMHDSAHPWGLLTETRNLVVFRRGLVLENV